MSKRSGYFRKLTRFLPEVGTPLINDANSLDKDLDYIAILLNNLEYEETHLNILLEESWSKDELETVKLQTKPHRSKDYFTEFAKCLPEVGYSILQKAMALDQDLAYIVELISEFKENEKEFFKVIEKNWSEGEIKRAIKKANK